jgi:DNA-binding ferritin-like protein (Dps family)
MCEIAVSLNIAIPKMPISLDAPVRWTFIGNTAIFNYIVTTNDTAEEIDTEILKNTLQLRINQGLENGTIDGKEASSVIFEDIAMPRIFVHSVEQTRNLVEISIVFVNKEYAKNYRANFAGEVGESLDIRDLEDDEDI